MERRLKCGVCAAAALALVLCFAPQIMRVYSSDDYIVRVGVE